MLLTPICRLRVRQRCVRDWRRRPVADARPYALGVGALIVRNEWDEEIVRRARGFLIMGEGQGGGGRGVRYYVGAGGLMGKKAVAGRGAGFNLR